MLPSGLVNMFVILSQNICSECLLEIKFWIKYNQKFGTNILIFYPEFYLRMFVVFYPEFYLRMFVPNFWLYFIQNFISEC